MSEIIHEQEIYLEKNSPNFESAYDELKREETKAEIEGFAERRKILDKYKEILILEDRQTLTEKELIEINEELESLDSKFTENGVHFLKCQLFRVIDALKEGRRVEIEGFTPYLRNYFQTGLDSPDVELTEGDEKGLAAMEEFFEFLPEAHAVSLADAYNTWSLNYDTGQPRPLTGQENPEEKIETEVSESYKKRFKEWVVRVLKSREIIKGDEKESHTDGYVINEESELVPGAEKLVLLLKKRGNIVEEPNGEIWFVQDAKSCEDPRFTRILLRDRYSHWQCAALDASQFLHSRNLEITHLIILPKENFEDQQDQVWEIIRKIWPDEKGEGFKALNLHNIFIDFEDPSLTPELIKETIRKKLLPFLK